MTRKTAIAVLLCSAFLLAGADTKPPQISTSELETYLKNKKVFFLDVREPDEIRKLGSVEGYVNIPLNQLEQRLNEVPRDKLIITL